MITIENMTNLWTGCNDTENFTVFIVALDEQEALEIAREYGNDIGMIDDWKIFTFGLSDISDCDYILTYGGK